MGRAAPILLNLEGRGDHLLGTGDGAPHKPQAYLWGLVTALRSSPSQRGFTGRFLLLKWGLCWVTSDAPNLGAVTVGGRGQECEIHIADLGVLAHSGAYAALFPLHTSPDLVFQLQE